MATVKNPRKKKLDAICTKIAMFMMVETFTDEQEAQKHLLAAFRSLEEAAKILVANDEKKTDEQKTA